MSVSLRLTTSIISTYGLHLSPLLLSSSSYSSSSLSSVLLRSHHRGINNVFTLPNGMVCYWLVVTSQNCLTLNRTSPMQIVFVLITPSFRSFQLNRLEVIFSSDHGNAVLGKCSLNPVVHGNSFCVDRNAILWKCSLNIVIHGKAGLGKCSLNSVIHGNAGL